MILSSSSLCYSSKRHMVAGTIVLYRWNFSPESPRRRTCMKLFMHSLTVYAYPSSPLHWVSVIVVVIAGYVHSPLPGHLLCDHCINSFHSIFVSSKKGLSIAWSLLLMNPIVAVAYRLIPLGRKELCQSCPRSLPVSAGVANKIG